MNSTNGGRLRNAIADAHEVMHELAIKRQRMRELVGEIEAKGERRAASIAVAEIADFDRLIEIISDMIAYLESLDQKAGPAE